MASSDFYFVNTVEAFYNDNTGMYKPVDSKFFTQNHDYPGLENFKKFLYVPGNNVTFYDRTESIKSPFNIKLHPSLTLPKFEKVSYTYAECCEQRAQELLDKAEATDRKVCVFYSGGIDSTAVVVAFLKIAKTKEQRERIVVMMSFESYVENKKFYDDHICNKLKVVPSHDFINLIGDPRYICITAEGNDQLFGSWYMKRIMINFGEKHIYDSTSQENLMKYMHNAANSMHHTENYVRLLNEVAHKCPVELDTMAKYLWWINLTIKWQCVYFRILSLVSPRQRPYVVPEENYFMFFSTKEFQLWSMNNSDKLIKDDIKSYKYICKDYIYEYNRDEEYWKEKMKVGSLPKICTRKRMAMAIDSECKYYDEFPSSTILTPNNSFIF
jgi:hypothetical protein